MKIRSAAITLHKTTSGQITPTKLVEDVRVKYLSRLDQPRLFNRTKARLRKLPLRNPQSNQQLFHDPLLHCYWLSLKSIAKSLNSEETLLRMPGDAARALIRGD